MGGTSGVRGIRDSGRPEPHSHLNVTPMCCAVLPCHRKVAAVVGHSKGGDVVLLYAATHDDVPLVVNLAGRFDMQRGLVERFGAETLARVDQLGQVPQATRTDSGAVVKFVITKQVGHNQEGTGVTENAWPTMGDVPGPPPTHTKAGPPWPASPASSSLTRPMGQPIPNYTDESVLRPCWWTPCTGVLNLGWLLGSRLP